MTTLVAAAAGVWVLAEPAADWLAHGGHDRQAALLYRLATPLPQFAPDRQRALADCLVRLGRSGEATHRLRAAIAAHPTDGALRAALGRALEGSGDILGALREYQMAHGAGNRDPRLLERLATLLSERGDLRLAEGICREALAAQPSLPWAQRVLACVLIAQGRSASAASLLDRALRARPQDAECWAMLGIALGMSGHDVARALRALDEAQLLGTSAATVHFAKAGALLQAGRKQEAAREAREAVRLGLLRATAFERWSRAVLALRDPAQTQALAEQLRQLLDLNPGLSGAHTALGKALLSQGRVATALREFEAAVQVQPTSMEAHYWLAEALLGQGNRKEALEELAEASRLADHQQCLRPALARSWLAAGALANARTEIVRAQAAGVTVPRDVLEKVGMTARRSR